jgi:hypothetical protein
VKTGINIEGPGAASARALQDRPGRGRPDPDRQEHKYQQEKGQWTLDGAYLPYIA